MLVGGRGQEVSADWKCPTDTPGSGARRKREFALGCRPTWLGTLRKWQEQPRQTRAGDSFSGPE